MKMPEKMPDWRAILERGAVGIPDALSEVIASANRDYLYWDKFKYQTLPDGIKPEMGWAILKLTREFQPKKSIPLPNLATKKPFTFWLPDTANEALHFIDQNAGGQLLVDDSSVHAAEKQRYIVKSLMEEAITSSQIEGAATTRAVAREMLRTGRKPRDRAERMIFNNYRTIIKVKDLLDQPLSIALIKQIHALISKDTLEDPGQEGRFRMEVDGDIKVFNEAGQILHDPPSPLEIEPSIELMCRFANQKDEGAFVHPVIKGILLHFWLAYLHPFVDGNGRTARALFYWFMLKEQYWLFEYLSISRVILKAPSRYYKAFLYTETDDGDLTYFVIFHLQAIQKAVKAVQDYLKKKAKESRDARQLLRQYTGLNHRQRALLAHALQNPDAVYTFTTHMRTHGVVYQTARTDLLDLHEKGFLEMQKIGRNFTFIPVAGIEEKLGGGRQVSGRLGIGKNR